MKERLLLTLSVILPCLLLTSCGSGTGTVCLTGHYMTVETEGKKNEFYLKDYLMMDCCREWNRICELCKSFRGACAVEGVEFRLYDENSEEVSGKEMLVRITPSGEFSSAECSSMRVINFGTLTWYDVSEEDGEVCFITDEPGIYLMVGYGDGKLRISNPACGGECSTCSDEW